jgi:hypothetical protein
VSISAQLTAHLSVSEPPAAALASWRAQRPPWLPDHYEPIDESYDSCDADTHRAIHAATADVQEGGVP